MNNLVKQFKPSQTATEFYTKHNLKAYQSEFKVRGALQTAFQWNSEHLKLLLFEFYRRLNLSLGSSIFQEKIYAMLGIISAFVNFLFELLLCTQYGLQHLV